VIKVKFLLILELKAGIREHYHSLGILYKIDGSFKLPQIIIENSLVLTYQQLQALYESGLLDKLLNLTQCEHIRFHCGAIVYAKESNLNSDDICIYCYSLKRTKKQVTIFCNQRDYNDTDNNDVIAFCEANEIRFKLVDYVNDKLSIFKEKTVVFNEDYEEPYRYEDFQIKVSNILSGKVKCEDCGKKLTSLEITVERCVSCSTPGLSTNSASSSFNTNTPLTEKRFKRNPYNFIEKLQLHQREFSVQEKKIRKMLDYSFKSDDVDFDNL
jgi:glutaredoxin